MPHRAPGASDGRKGHYLSGKPIKYYRPRGSQDVRALVDDGFQAFNGARLSEACHIFSEKMLDPDNDTTIGITVAGALTPAGLGGCLIELMERGLVDFVISTGANLYHDLHYALNFTLHRGSPFLDDRDLYDEGVIRIYDVLFPATVLLETDAYVRDFLVRCGIDEPISTSELHVRLGQDLLSRREGCENHSVLAAAAKYGVPIYTSSPGDSSIGMNIAYHEFMNNSRLMIDPNKDVNEICAIVLSGHKNGCVILGGGSPKNFYLQAQPTLWEVYGSRRAATSTSSSSPPIKWSGADCRAPRPRRPSAGARSTLACCPTRWWPTWIRPLRSRFSASTRSARASAGESDATSLPGAASCWQPCVPKPRRRPCRGRPWARSRPSAIWTGRRSRGEVR